MLTVFAALQMEYGVLQPEQLEPLMAGLAAGDQEALGQLYHRTRTAVYGLAAVHHPKLGADETAGAGPDTGSSA